MVRLVIEQVTACDVRRLHAVFALIVRVSEPTRPKSGVEPREERFNPRVFARPRALQTEKIVVQNLV